jgi:hypothetical protein
MWMVGFFFMQDGRTANLLPLITPVVLSKKWNRGASRYPMAPLFVELIARATGYCARWRLPSRSQVSKSLSGG